MPLSAREYAGYSFVSHKDVVPLMTPWSKQQYLSTKPSWGPLAVTDSTDPVNPTDAKNGNKVLNLRHIFDSDGKEIPLGPPVLPGQS